jgi:hypothetical protein
MAAPKEGSATEQVGALALRGLSQPVVAYNVVLANGRPAGNEPAGHLLGI